MSSKNTNLKATTKVFAITNELISLVVASTNIVKKNKNASRPFIYIVNR